MQREQRNESRPLLRFRRWLLRRALGLAMIADGLTQFFSGWKTGLPLIVARRIAVINGKLMGREALDA